MILIEHQPATDAHFRSVLGQAKQTAHRPARVIGAHARSRFDYNRAVTVSAPAWMVNQPDVKIFVGSGMAIGAFWPFFTRQGKIAFDGDGQPFGLGYGSLS